MIPKIWNWFFWKYRAPMLELDDVSRRLNRILIELKKAQLEAETISVGANFMTNPTPEQRARARELQALILRTQESLLGLKSYEFFSAGKRTGLIMDKYLGVEMKKPLALVVLLLTGFMSFGCAPKGGGDSSPAPAPVAAGPTQSVFAIWTKSGTDHTTDLSPGHLDFSFVMHVTSVSTGQICGCDMILAGKSNYSGSWMSTNCAYLGGGSGDPGCSALLGLGTYNVDSSNNLQMCPNNTTTCSNYTIGH